MLTKAQILSQVEKIRTDAELWLNTTLTLRHYTGETVVGGQSFPQYSSSTVLGRIIIRTGDDRTNTAAQFRQPHLSTFTGLYRIQLPYGTVVVEGDKIEYTDIETGNVRKCEVVYSPPFHELMGAFVITVKEIQ